MDKSVAYSLLTIKEVSEDQRVIRGMATTPEADRVGDVVEPLGVEYNNPAPLLWMHNHQLPVGTVTFGKPTAKGVPFEAKLPVVSEPSQLKARIDEAWASIKAGLIRAVSIGFRPLEYSINEETGGLRFLRSEVYELSLVSVPANASATISYIKSLDAEARSAAIGETKQAKQPEKKPAVAGKPVKIQPKETKMNITKQLKGFRDELALKKKKLVELAEKSADESFDDAQQEEFDTITQEVKTLEAHIGRLEIAEKAAEGTAKPVTEDAGQDEGKGSKVRQGITVKAVAESVPGIAFARLAKAKALSRQHQMPAAELARKLWPDDQRIALTLEKAAVAAGTTLDSSWAKPLVPEEASIYADFAEFLRPATILGKFGQGSVPDLRRVPFRTRLLGQTSGGSAQWVGEGNAKPLTKFDFAGTSLDPLKVAAIAVITKELALDSNPSAEALVRDGLRDAVVERLDLDFIDPAITAVNNVRPASITNGVTPVVSTGTDADDVRCDMQALLSKYIAANNAPTSGVLIMSSLTALALSMMLNPLGQSEFPGITMNGGILLGFPVIVSEYVPADSSGHYVIMVNAKDIYYADGEISVDMSDQASLQMNDTPDNPTTASTVLVSLWQRNLVGFLVEKRVNYSKRRPSAVAVLSGVNWGACA